MKITSSLQERVEAFGSVVCERLHACVTPTSLVVNIPIYCYPMMTFVWK